MLESEGVHSGLVSSWGQQAPVQAFGPSKEQRTESGFFYAQLKQVS